MTASACSVRCGSTEKTRICEGRGELSAGPPQEIRPRMNPLRPHSPHLKQMITSYILCGHGGVFPDLKDKKLRISPTVYGCWSCSRMTVKEQYAFNDRYDTHIYLTNGRGE